MSANGIELSKWNCGTAIPQWLLYIWMSVAELRWLIVGRVLKVNRHTVKNEFYSFVRVVRPKITCQEKEEEETHLCDKNVERGRKNSENKPILRPSLTRIQNNLK